MEDTVQSLPTSVESNLDNDESIEDILSEFFDIVGDSRFEDSVRLDLHIPTGDIIAQQEDANDTIARLAFNDDTLTTEEITRDEFRDIRQELTNISRPRDEVNVIHD